jgi:ribosomal protein S2
MRRAAKIDANQPLIVEALRKAGATVQSLAAVGQGVPDLLVGYRNKTALVEVKDGSKCPSARQHQNWTGGTLAVVPDVDAALRVLKLMEASHAE